MKQAIKDYLLFVLVLTVLNVAGPLAVFLPLPFFLFKEKFSFSTLFLSAFIPAIILFPFLPDKLSFFVSLLHYGSLVVPTLVIIFLFRYSNLNSFQRLFISSLSILVFIIALGVISNYLLGRDFFIAVFEQFFKTSKIPESDLEYIKNVFYYAGYGLVFFSEAMFFLFNTVFFSKASGVLRDFAGYKVDVFVVVFTVVFILCVNILWITGYLHGYILQTVATLSLFLFYIFFVQGFAIYLYFLNKVGFSGFAKVLSIVLIFIYPLPAILALVGILDFWLDFRLRISKIGGGKLV